MRAYFIYVVLSLLGMVIGYRFFCGNATLSIDDLLVFLILSSEKNDNKNSYFFAFLR